MCVLNFIDRFSIFEARYNPSKSSEALFELWKHVMKSDSELFHLCYDDYEKEGIDPTDFALNAVFTYDPNAFNRMKKARDLVFKLSKDIITTFQKHYDLVVKELSIVVYHGLGNAAGMVEAYYKKPAILFGVEKIVALKWDSEKRIGALIAHELAHVVHQSFSQTLTPYTDFKQKHLYRIYTEGIATYLESVVASRAITSANWFIRGKTLENELKMLFLKKLVKEDTTIKHFFGDWYPVLGMEEAGYFLGLRLIQECLKTYSIKELLNIDHSIAIEMVKTYLKRNEEGAFLFSQ